MPIVRILGTFAIIPTTLLLTMSFFVFLSVQSIEVQGLRLFGYFVAVLLCMTAALIFFTGIFVLLTGRNPFTPLLQYVIKHQGARSDGLGLRS
jgi:hypothetical protein